MGGFVEAIEKMYNELERGMKGYGSNLTKEDIDEMKSKIYEDNIDKQESV